MILYQLPNGKTILVSIDDVLNMSNGVTDYLVNRNLGNSSEDPFDDSALEEDELLDSESDIDLNEIPDPEGLDYENFDE